MKNIILVTYDNHRIDYPRISYSIASLLATLKHYDIPASHYSFDIRKFAQTAEGHMPFDVIIDQGNIIDYLKSFSVIAFGVTRWSEPFTYMLIRKLKDYEGKIVLGGYEITALKEDDEFATFLKQDLKINHFINGYAEKPLVKIVRGEYQDSEKFIREDLDERFLFSPYSSGVLSTYSRKIYWETKRGCNSRCGFCEWGNAQIGFLELNQETIENDIEIFSKSNIEEINILDGTFNVGRNYLRILKNLLEKTTSKITFQARFETLKPELIDICSAHKERLHLEFGLQTIHENEMKVIGRTNNINSVKNKMKQLNLHNIDYEVSIIYAIPGQNITTFIDTIEFLRINGCKKIMAYPLQIPRNSELDNKKRDYKIILSHDKFYVKSVSSCYSFNNEDRFEMDCIAFSLLYEEKGEVFASDQLTLIKGTQYQYELPEAFVDENRKSLDSVVSSAFCRFESYRIYLNSAEFESSSPPKGAIQIEGSGYLDFALGLERYKSVINCKNSKPQLIKFRTVIGHSGYIYIFRDNGINQ